ncbi:Ppx/GppA phosphatase family protein [Secundilactobacillus malefermentans]|uniref:Ppx/GppA phosphatase family protein n=1 Tax=Secundilactobacillus malefermentans TaxID=176292 RepID=UPI0011CA0F69|nr:exopolyphosphatase [Secundilactobacillus malefermentans]QEA31905.1 exopolyphosphatase [Secundilactobacillus malefermentans]
MKNLVIVDLGSNSVRMAIIEISANGHHREVYRTKRDSRISQGMGTGKKKTLQEVAMARTIAAMKSFKARYERLPNVTLMGITTAAVRQASNQQEFVSRVKKEIGLDLRILSGDEEAYYDYLGAATRLKIEDCLILDIGGASCELINVKDGKEVNLISVPFGAVTLTEQFHLNDVVTAAGLFTAETFLSKRLRDIWWLNDAIHKPLVLLGGANRTLARISRKQQQFLHVENIHGYRLKTDDVFNLFKKLIQVDLAGRKQISGLETGRADIIVGGVLPLVLLLQLLDSDRVVFSESGVREGIISEFIKKG